MELSSFFCTKGKDNPIRFITIEIFAVIGFALSWLVFAHTPLLWLLGLLIIGVITLSAYRRVLDSKKGLLGVILCALANSILFANLVVPSGWLGLSMSLLLVALTTFFVAKDKSQTRGQFVQGYCGPKQVTPRIRPARMRIEPTLGEQPPKLAEPKDQIAQHQYDSEPPHQDLLQQSWQQLLQQLQALPLKPITIAASLLVSLLVITIMVTHLINDEGEYQDESPAQVQSEQLNSSDVSLDDGLDLHLVVANNQFYVSWFGEANSSGRLWDLATATGDLSCSELSFNKNDKFRPIQVDVLDTGKTRAQFSPLDTKAIINQLAKRNQASICGYKFSLKGSTNAMSINDDFFNLMD
ncbi:hypothetical protein [Paraferrimonas sp. SM1919]|uniref:hypothetical protein n=1 Tax=Paraferrimonas sp. SM1919 TaxID=2662263 RepID=UPI0013D3B89D|nr:hypothetical protein [Paraferrimonas sp. SM1919]